MTVLLSFGNSIGIKAVLNKQLRERIFDLGRIYKIPLRDLEISVIFKHTCIDNIGDNASVEVTELLAAVKCHRDLDSSVASEIEEDNAVAVLHFAYRLAVLGDNELRQILINSRGLISECINSGLSIGELSGAAVNVCVPASLYHAPVSLISVHSDLHTSAARSYLSIERSVIELSNAVLELLDVDRSRSSGYITSVKQNVASYLLNALLLSLSEHLLEVVNV